MSHVHGGNMRHIEYQLPTMALTFIRLVSHHLHSLVFETRLTRRIQNESFISSAFRKYGICRGQGLSCKWDNKHNFRCRLICAIASERANVNTYFVHLNVRNAYKTCRERKIRPTLDTSNSSGFARELWVCSQIRIINLLFLYNNAIRARNESLARWTGGRRLALKNVEL